MKIIQIKTVLISKNSSVVMNFTVFTFAIKQRQIKIQVNYTLIKFRTSFQTLKLLETAYVIVFNDSRKEIITDTNQYSWQQQISEQIIGIVKISVVVSSFEENG